MPNLYKLNEKVVTTDVYNLSGKILGLSGHYRIWLNVENGNMLCQKFADYGSLTYVRESNDLSYFEPSEVQKNFFLEVIFTNWKVKIGNPVKTYPKKNGSDFSQYVFSTKYMSPEYLNKLMLGELKLRSV